MKLLEFQRRKSIIVTPKIKGNHLTLFAVKSKQIDLQSSAWWHKIAFLQSFPMVTDVHVFF